LARRLQSEPVAPTFEYASRPLISQGGKGKIAKLWDDLPVDDVFVIGLGAGGERAKLLRIFKFDDSPQKRAARQLDSGDKLVVTKRPPC